MLHVFLDIVLVGCCMFIVVAYWLICALLWICLVICLFLGVSYLIVLIARFAYCVTCYFCCL